MNAAAERVQLFLGSREREQADQLLPHGEVCVRSIRSPDKQTENEDSAAIIQLGDDSLVQCLVEIRRVLGEHDPITTVRGRGYRFDAPIVVPRNSTAGRALPRIRAATGGFARDAPPPRRNGRDSRGHGPY